LHVRFIYHIHHIFSKYFETRQLSASPLRSPITAVRDWGTVYMCAADCSIDENTNSVDRQQQKTCMIHLCFWLINMWLSLER